jgi:hypothetical protein
VPRHVARVPPSCGAGASVPRDGRHGHGWSARTIGAMKRNCSSRRGAACCSLGRLPDPGSKAHVGCGRIGATERDRCERSGSGKRFPSAGGKRLVPVRYPAPAAKVAGAGRVGGQARGACQPIYRAAPRAECNLPLQRTIVPKPKTQNPKPKTENRKPVAGQPESEIVPVWPDPSSTRVGSIQSAWRIR